MDEHISHFDTLLELETRHVDLLRRLEVLDEQVEKVLAECSASFPPVEPSGFLDRPPQPQAHRDTDRTAGYPEGG